MFASGTLSRSSEERPSSRIRFVSARSSKESPLVGARFGRRGRRWQDWSTAHPLSSFGLPFLPGITCTRSSGPSLETGREESEFDGLGSKRWVRGHMFSRGLNPGCGLDLCGKNRTVGRKTYWLQESHTLHGSLPFQTLRARETPPNIHGESCSRETSSRKQWMLSNINGARSISFAGGSKFPRYDVQMAWHGLRGQRCSISLHAGASVRGLQIIATARKKSGFKRWFSWSDTQRSHTLAELL